MRIKFKATKDRKEYWDQNIHLKDGESIEIPDYLAENYLLSYPKNFIKIELNLSNLLPPIHPPLKMSNITIITIHYWPKVLEKYLLPTIPEEVEFIQLDNFNNERWESLAEAYNYGIRRASNDIVICVHEDVKFGKDWFEKFIQQECRLANWGALGILGMDYNKQIYWGKDYLEPKEIPLLDECCIILNKKNGIFFDEKTFKSYHSYGLDFSLQCHKKGLGVYLLTGEVEHAIWSKKHVQKWFEAIKFQRELLEKKWGKPLLPYKKKILFLLWRDYNTASCRVRGFKLGERLKELGYRVYFNQKPSTKVDIVIALQRYSEEWLDWGEKTIFDINDNYFIKGMKDKIYNIAKKVDLVLVSTKYLGNYFAEENIPFKVLPTPFDLETKALKANYKKQNILGWVGGFENEKYLTPYLELFKKLGYKLKIIANGLILPKQNFIEYISWNLQFSNYLLDCDFGIAPLDNGEWEKAKSAGKPLSYWAIRLPVIASPNPEYEEIEDRFAIKFIARNIESWETILSWNEKKRKKQAQEGYEIAWTNFSPKKIGDKLAKILEEL